MSNGIDAWSYSRLSTYELCPLKAKLTYVLKAPFVQSAAGKRGDDVHKSLAAWVTHDTTAKGPDMDFWKSEIKAFSQFEGCIAELRTQRPIVEQQWGFDNRLRPKGWFGKEVWYRCILDVGILYADNFFDVVDYKTGKKYDTNEDQMEQFAMAVFARYPQVHTVGTRLWYLDQTKDNEAMAEYPRKDFAKIADKWDARVKIMMTDTVFAPRPNRLCPWCDFRKSNGGVCEFG